MALSNLWTLGLVVTSGGQLNQLRDLRVDSGLETLIECSDGSADYTFAAVNQQRPVLSFATTAIARALTVAGISGLSIASAADAYFQKYAPGGTRQAGGTTTKFTVTKGILVPRSLDASHDAPAMLDCDLAAVSADGTSAPLAVAVSQIMPAPLGAKEYFCAGPCSLNGTPIPGVKRISVDFGIDLILEGSDGEPWPTFIAIQRRRPTISVRSVDANLASTFAGFFVGQGATDSTFHLRKYLAGGTRVPNITAEHIRFTVDDGIATVRTVAGDDGRPTESEVLMECTFDGTNDPIAVSTASAIA